jgi:hypothetical protein
MERIEVLLGTQLPGFWVGDYRTLAAANPDELAVNMAKLGRIQSVNRWRAAP